MVLLNKTVYFYFSIFSVKIILNTSIASLKIKNTRGSAGKVNNDVSAPEIYVNRILGTL